MSPTGVDLRFAVSGGRATGLGHVMRCATWRGRRAAAACRWTSPWPATSWPSGPSRRPCPAWRWAPGATARTPPKGRPPWCSTRAKRSGRRWPPPPGAACAPWCSTAWTTWTTRTGPCCRSSTARPSRTRGSSRAPTGASSSPPPWASERRPTPAAATCCSSPSADRTRTTRRDAWRPPWSGRRRAAPAALRRGTRRGGAPGAERGAPARRLRGGGGARATHPVRIHGTRPPGDRRLRHHRLRARLARHARPACHPEARRRRGGPPPRGGRDRPPGRRRGRPGARRGARRPGAGARPEVAAAGERGGPRRPGGRLRDGARGGSGRRRGPRAARRAAP